MQSQDEGLQMHKTAYELWPINRSITGDGFRQSLAILERVCGLFNRINIPSGTRVFDWTIPPEWNFFRATLIDSQKKVILDSSNSNLHVMGYSDPIDTHLNLADLSNHLYFREDLPNAIPYITSYYEDRWGLCLSYNDYKLLKDDTYHVRINATKAPGYLTIGELIIPGKSKKEILFSTYLCHPSMANNELSGPILAVYLARYLNSLRLRKYTYRFVICPETIGSLAYINRSHTHLKKSLLAGYVLSCVGNEGPPSLIPTIEGNTYSDWSVKRLFTEDRSGTVYSWRDRGSDERQYTSPLLRLPVVGICKAKYGTYEQYHTSLDDLSYVTPLGLQQSFELLVRLINLVESSMFPISNHYGEPMMSQYDLYPTLSTHQSSFKVHELMDLLHLADGRHSTIQIAEILSLKESVVVDIYSILNQKGIISYL